MAANFQPHMGGAAPMMPQQQPQQQRPMPPNQVQHHIFQALSNQPAAVSGWQVGMIVQERLGLVLSIVGNLRLASQHHQNPPPFQRIIEMALKFEKEIFEKSPDKARYKQELQQKLEQLLEKRTQNQPGLQQSINLQAQAQAQAQQIMMTQNGMHGQVPRPMGQQPSQQGFHHLQHQMQNAPIQGQQPQQMPVGIPNEGVPPNMGQAQQQFQMPMQQPQQLPQNAGRAQNGPPQLNAGEAAMIQELTNRLMNQATPEEKNQVRMNVQSRMDPATFQKYQSQGIDPIIFIYRNQAMSRLRQEKQARMVQAQQQLAISQQQSQNVPTTAPAMQQQRSMNPSPLNGQAQPPTSVGGNQDFSFAGNMGNLIDQQQQGVMAQERGQMVVPASSAQRNPTPQPGTMPNPQMAMNDQRQLGNQNARGQQQQQQIFNAQQAQQAQQQRMQHTAQQQSQAAVRATAQAKAQQIGLQGQPGGMGTGPMPPQQSPAMGTLNTPLRSQSQQGNNNPEPPQANPNAQFGQPLDPRFMQANQRQPGPGNAVNGAALNPMFASMPLDQQQRLASLPPDKLNEVVNKWHEQRAQQISAANAQAGRPPMPMQGAGQARPPGQQVPQPGQANHNAITQFMMANPGQRPPPALMANMNPQQQQMVQMRIQQMQNPLQQRNAPAPIPNEQRILMQMDNMEFPPSFQNHQFMPRGFPADIKKWGPLKQWVQMNMPEAQEGIRALQRMHYQGLRSKSQQPQPMGLQNGAQGGQVSGTMGPGGVPAPVAPMGPNQTPATNGMNMNPGQIRQPTAQDIQAARNHPGGKMASLTDDQIRTILMRNQLTAQQQQQKQNAMAQVQMMNQMPQADGQHPRPGAQAGPGQQGNQMANKNAPLPKSGPPADRAAPAPATNNGRAARPAPVAGRATGQNSSPAQPAKNLKRSSSDDVIEVPNPNGAQQPRPAPQQNQGQKPTLQQPPRYTEQQLSTLSPEERKRYEQAQRNFQVSRERQSEAEQLRAIAQEEAQRHEALPDIPMDRETKQAMVNLLREIQSPLANMGRAVLGWFQITHDVARAKLFFRTRHRLQKQFRDLEKMTQPRDTFSIKPVEVEQARAMLSSMVRDLSDRFPAMKQPKGAQGQAQPTPVSQAQVTPTPQAAPPPGGPTAPLNAANLQQQQQQLNKMHQRSGSRSSHAPAAPTSSQAPFHFGATSPNGAVKYASATATITQENLHIPARKKQKPNNTPTQNAPTNPSPRISKPVSPDSKRRQVPDAKPKPVLCCPEPECDRHKLSFDTEEALKHHNDQEHVQPLADPLKYAQDNILAVLNLDSEGRPKKPDRPTPIGKAVSSETPDIKGETTPAASNTPMNRQVSMSRQGTSNTKAAPEAKGVSLDKISGKQEELDPWANCAIPPHSLPDYHSFASGASGAISDLNVYRSIATNDTPESSKDGLTEPNSDISEGVGLDINLDIFDETWQPFSSDMGFVTAPDVKGGLNQDPIVLDENPDGPLSFSWEDLVDQTAFDTPFQFDNSAFSIVD